MDEQQPKPIRFDEAARLLLESMRQFEAGRTYGRVIVEVPYQAGKPGLIRCSNETVHK